MSIVKSFSVGEGDMFYIRHGSDSFTIIDCCMSAADRETIVADLKIESSDKGIVRFISTHPDDDHILGMKFLQEKMKLVNFYCVKNEAIKENASDDFDQYCELRKDAFYLSRNCSRRWLNDSNEERGSAGIRVLWPITNNKHYVEALKEAGKGENPNNISPILRYALGNSTAIMWMGDLEFDFMEKIKKSFEMEKADILFAPHHGRDTGKVPSEWLETVAPQIIIIGEAPSKHLNYYEGYNTITQNSAGDIVLECETGKVHIYVSNEEYSVDYLEDEGQGDTYGKYIGTLSV